MRLFTTLSLIALLVSSCVTPKVHNELQSSYDNLVHANESLKEASDKATTAHRESLSDLKKAASNLDQITHPKGISRKTFLDTSAELVNTDSRINPLAG